MADTHSCPVCQGSGMVGASSCSRCRGTGAVRMPDAGLLPEPVGSDEISPDVRRLVEDELRAERKAEPKKLKGLLAGTRHKGRGLGFKH